MIDSKSAKSYYQYIDPKTQKGSVKSKIFSDYELELFDELELFISIYNPNEIIIIYDFDDEKYIDSLISFSSINSNCIHKINLNHSDNENTIKAKKCTKQVFQKEIMKNTSLITKQISYWTI